MGLAVIVVTHESAPVLEPCLERLVGRGDLEVIVVDNASTDQSVAIARRATPHVLVQERNLGLATAANAGARIARADRLCFLNPDCVLDDDCLEAMEKAWELSPDACLVPDLWEHEAGAYVGAAAGLHPAKAPRGRSARRGRGRDPRLRASSARARQGSTIFAGTGPTAPVSSCLRRLFEAVGGFDERLLPLHGGLRPSGGPSTGRRSHPGPSLHGGRGAAGVRR